jgi:L-threonylcarbamoyladenylate synthase
MHQSLSKLLSPGTSTRVLRCDPAAIHFHPSKDQPEISCPDTLRALKTASHHLVDLLEPVAFPTETVYGLGATALNTSAASRIFSTKGRPADNPLIVHVSSLNLLNTLLPKDYILPRSYQTLIKHFWPGPLTLLFPREAGVVPTIISAGLPAVAIRMPSHPVARALIAIANAPLAAPSANSSGKPSPTRAEHVLQDLDGKINIILDGGACDVGLESTVVDGLHEDGHIRVLRPGGVTVEDIERVLTEDLGRRGNVPKVMVHRRDYQDEAMEAAPTTPGMKYRHYSPSVPLTLLRTLSQPPENERSMSAVSFLESLKQTHPGKIGVLAPDDSSLWSLLPSSDAVEWCPYRLGPKENPAVAAHRLFDGLLSLESRGVDMMLIEEITEDREGLAVMNRVRKAAGGIQWVTYGSTGTSYENGLAMV